MALTQISTKGIKDGTITNADIGSSAAIAGSKISPDFGSQNIATTGDLSCNDISLQGNNPRLFFTEDDGNPDYKLHLNGGILQINDQTNNASRFQINTDGHIDVGHLDVGAGLDVTGNITATGNLTVADLPNTTNNALMKIAIQDTDGVLKSDDVIKINPNQGTLHVNNLYLANNHIRAGGNGPLHLTTANANGTVDINISNTHVEVNGNLLPATDSTDNLGSNTVRWANAYVDTYYGDGSNLTGINTDLVSDTTPQLGGNLDTNSFEISFDDNHSAIFGDGSDLKILHTGSESRIDFTNTAHDLKLMGSGGSSVIELNPRHDHNSVKAIANGAVELYYDNGIRIETSANGVIVRGPEGGVGELYINADEGDDFADIWRLQTDTSGVFTIANGASGRYETNIECNGNGNVELYHNNSKKIETTSSGVSVTGQLDVGSVTLSGGGLALADNDKVVCGNGDDLQIYFDGSNSFIKEPNSVAGQLIIDGYNGTDIRRGATGDHMIRAIGGGSVELYEAGTKKLETTTTGVTFNGTGAILVPKGTTAQRPTGANGHVRYNETTNALEGYINGGWVTVKVTGLAEDGKYANNTQATADDLWGYWDCDSTSTTRAGGDSGAATLYGVTSQGGKISNSWDRGTSATNGVLLTSMPTGNNFTLMFQLYRTRNQTHSYSDGAAIIHLDGALSGGSEGSVILGYDGSNGVDLRFGGNGWVNDGETVLGNFSNDNWYHMVITRSSGTTWKFYLDGSLITTRTETMSVGSSWMLGNHSRVNGNGNTNAHYFRGRFDEIAVWDRTLTASEISSVYTAQDAGTALI